MEWTLTEPKPRAFGKVGNIFKNWSLRDINTKILVSDKICGLKSPGSDLVDE